jgi:hypothetical protein
MPLRSHRMDAKGLRGVDPWQGRGQRSKPLDSLSLPVAVYPGRIGWSMCAWVGITYSDPGSRSYALHRSRSTSASREFTYIRA